MTKKYEYSVFPTTFKARLLLAIAFLAGAALTFGWLGFVVIQSAEILSFEEPCTGSKLESCLEPQEDLRAIASDACADVERRICIAPLGRISPDLVHHLVEYYQEEYGLYIRVLRPGGLPRELVDEERDQIDLIPLIDHMRQLYPDAARDRDAVLIGLTPLDIYDSRTHYRFLFGSKNTYENPEAVISTHRMDPRTFTFGLVSDDDLIFSRARKLFTKYVGLLYYGLPPSDHPESPLYDSILSTGDLDNMQEQLDVPAGY